MYQVLYKVIHFYLHKHTEQNGASFSTILCHDRIVKVLHNFSLWTIDALILNLTVFGGEVFRR